MGETLHRLSFITPRNPATVKLIWYRQIGFIRFSTLEIKLL